MDDLLHQFLLEGRDLVAEAHAALIALGSDGHDRAALDRLFRATHTLKGSVAIFDMAPAEQLLHAAETRLEAARRDAAPLDEATLDQLMAAIDQTDRWIDAMEAKGALDTDAAAQSSRLIAQLESGEEAAADPDPPPPQDEADWLAALRDRPGLTAIDTAQARTAFRYTPDPDCFFRGEDPLAIAAKVPDLLWLSVQPAGGGWPSLDMCDPFRCTAEIEGVSAADEAAVRAAFRLMPDQVALAPFGTTAKPADALDRPNEAVTSLRVEAAKLDHLADQSGEMAVAVRALRPLVERLRSVDPQMAAELDAVQDGIARTASALQRSIAQVRRVPLEPVLRRLPRLAREAAASLGKQIRFTLDGEGASVDKHLADQLFEPLLHIVRNAVDHGIEPPSERTAAGKAAEGLLHLSVRQDGSHVMIRIADDGRGIDGQTVRDAAVAKGLTNGEAAASLTDAEALRLIFRAGFSTAGQTTSLSGRGVGMDVVQATVERLAGTIAVESTPGRGTVFTLRLPASALITPLLLVDAGGQRLGLRLDQIAETARLDAASIQPVGQAHACVLRDMTVPVFDLAALLGLPPTEADLVRLVVTDFGQGRTALRVAGFGERFDAVVREGSGLLAKLPAVAGTTMMPDGSVLLVLDLPELVG